MPVCHDAATGTCRQVASPDSNKTLRWRAVHEIYVAVVTGKRSRWAKTFLATLIALSALGIPQ